MTAANVRVQTLTSFCLVSYLLFTSAATGLYCTVLSTSIYHSERNIVKTSKGVKKAKNMFDFGGLFFLRKQQGKYIL